MLATPDDFDAWLELAGEVEPLFGPMVDDEGFRSGLRQVLGAGLALCCRDADGLQGGIIVDPDENEILWLAVTQRCRGLGIGRQLLADALELLDVSRPVKVVTFAGSESAGLAARKLYESFGFRDTENGGLNPAGIPTVVMLRGCDAG